MSWIGEPGGLSRLVNVENIGFVFGPHKARDSKDPPGLSRGVGDRNLDFIFTFVERSGQGAFGKAWER